MAMKIEEMGYVLGDDLRLRQASHGQPFRFIDKKHYEELADAVTGCVQQLMVQKFGMRKIHLPLAKEVIPWKKKKLSTGEGSPIFLSSNAMHTKRLLILICGSGRFVRAGVWSRKVCINDSFTAGSVLPFLEWAQAHDTSVLVLNPNDEGVLALDTNIPSGSAHVIYAWDAICRRLPAEHIAIVAHSAGGHDTCELLKHRGEEVMKRLRCIALGDTVQLCVKRLPPEGRMFFARNAMDWVVSRKVLDSPVRKASPSIHMFKRCNGKAKGSMDRDPETVEYNCEEVSAGTTHHEEVIGKAFTSICEFVLSKFNESEGLNK